MWKSQVCEYVVGARELAFVLLLWWSGPDVFRFDKNAPPTLMTHSRGGGANGVDASVIRVQRFGSQQPFYRRHAKAAKIPVTVWRVELQRCSSAFVRHRLRKDFFFFFA